jgi:hypothetical protein
MKQGNSGRLSQFFALVVTALILVGLVLFATLNPAQALYKATDAVNSWDPDTNQGAGGYTHSLQTIPFDGHWQPFLHLMDGYDAGIYPTDVIGTADWHPNAPLDACPGVPGSTSTRAGLMEFGLGHIDTTDLAPGFQHSDEWKIVPCDRDGDGSGPDFDPISPTDDGKEGIVEATDVIFEVVEVDAVEACSNKTCEYEIVTTLYVNFDTNCNDLLDDGNIPAGGLCFYALGQTATVATWGGNLQARVSAAGGDQTINFHVISGPLAVKLAALDASSGGAWLVAGLALALGAVLGGGTILARRRKR